LKRKPRCNFLLCIVLCKIIIGIWCFVHKNKLEMFCNSLWDLTNTKISDVLQLIVGLDQQKIRHVLQLLMGLDQQKFRNVLQLIIRLDPPQEGSKIYPLPLAYFLLLRIIFLNFQLFSQTSNPSFHPWLKVRWGMFNVLPHPFSSSSPLKSK
jgi:hypothetical protein